METKDGVAAHGLVFLLQLSHVGECQLFGVIGDSLLMCLEKKVDDSGARERVFNWIQQLFRSPAALLASATPATCFSLLQKSAAVRSATAASTGSSSVSPGAESSGLMKSLEKAGDAVASRISSLAGYVWLMTCDAIHAFNFSFIYSFLCLCIQIKKAFGVDKRQSK